MRVPSFGLCFREQMLETAVNNLEILMKSRSRKLKIKKMRRPSPLRRIRRPLREPKQPTLLERIALVTDELQMLRSRLANAGDDLPAVGTHRIAALETELEKLWEMRRLEQAAPLRQTALSDEEEKVLAFPSGSRSN
jgi:hypothetical protein